MNTKENLIMSLPKNFTGCAERNMRFYTKQNYQEGQILKLGSSWTDGDNYNVKENMFGSYLYVFMCDNLCGHKIDYEKLTDEEKKILGTSAELSDENEVLVSSEQTFKITDMSTDDDYKEMKYYIVEVEMQ